MLCRLKEFEGLKNSYKKVDQGIMAINCSAHAIRNIVCRDNNDKKANKRAHSHCANAL